MSDLLVINECMNTSLNNTRSALPKVVSKIVKVAVERKGVDFAEDLLTYVLPEQAYSDDKDHTGLDKEVEKSYQLIEQLKLENAMMKK